MSLTQILSPNAKEMRIEQLKDKFFKDQDRLLTKLNKDIRKVMESED